MKLIVETETKLVKFVLSDDTALEVADTITVGDPVEFTIADMDSSNSTIYENVTDTPEDWAGWKYMYDGSEWTLNENWYDPRVEEDPLAPPAE